MRRRRRRTMMMTSGNTNNIRKRGGTANDSSGGRPKNGDSMNRHSRGSSGSSDDDDNTNPQTTTCLDDRSTTPHAEEEDEGGAGEQTAVLNAAAAYMARMERVYRDDDTNDDAATTAPPTTTNATASNHSNDDDYAGKYHSSRPNNHRSSRGEKLFGDGTRNEASERGTARNEPSRGRDYLAPDDDDDEFANDSFYIIGEEEDGFRRSSSVHESDISVTDGEAYENDHHHHHDDDDDDVNQGDNAGDDGTTTVTTSLSGVSSVFCTFGEALERTLDDDKNVDSWMRDRDEPQNNNDDDDGKLVIGVARRMSPPTEAKAGTVEETETVVINDAVPLPAATTTTTTRDGKCDDDEREDNDVKSTTTPPSSTKVVHHRNVLPPTNPPPSSVPLLLDAEAADDAKSPSSAPDDRQRPSPTTQTPPPSASSSRRRDCAMSTSLQQMLYQQERELLRMIRSIDALSSTPGRIARLCDEEMMENDDCDDDIMYDMVLEEDDLEEHKLDDCEGGNDSNYDHHNGTSKKEKPSQEGERSRRNEENENCAHLRSLVSEYCLDAPTTRTEASMIPSMLDDSTRSEMNSPAMHCTGTNCETNMPPPPSSTKSEPTTWQNNSRFSGMTHSSPLASHANELLPPNRMNYSRSSPSTHSCVLSTSGKPSSSDLNAEAHRTDVISECRMTAENGEAKQNPEFMPRDCTENKEQVIEVTDTIQKLFRDADTLLQNFLASPDLVEKGMREEYCFTPSSIVSSSQADDSHLAAGSKERSDVKRENEDVLVDERSLLQVTGHSNNEAAGVEKASVPDMVAAEHIDDDQAPTVKNEDELLLSSDDGALSVQDALAADEYQTKLSLPNDEHKVMVSNESIEESDKWVCGYAILGANAEDDPSCNANGHTPSETKNLASATSFVNSVDDICVDTSCDFDRGNHLHANETFDTAIGSLDGLGREFDRFFDAKETMNDDTPAQDSFGDTQSQKNNIHDIVSAAADVVHDTANCDAVETNGIDNIATGAIELNKVPYCRKHSRDTAGGNRNFKADNRLELLRADNNSEKVTETVQTNAAHQPGDDTDFLTTDDCTRNSTPGSSSITSVKSFQKSTLSSSNGEIGVIDMPMVSISQTASNEHTVSPVDQYEDESQAIDGGIMHGQSNLGVLDDSVSNESIFMPNVSIDAESSSPKSPDCLSTSAGLLTGMSEDESEEVDDSDNEAFFPNLDLTSKTKAATATVTLRIKKDQPPVSKCSHVPAIAAAPSIESKQTGVKMKSMAASAPSSSRSLPLNKVPLGRSTTNNFTSRANQLPHREETQKHTTSSMKLLNPSSQTVPWIPPSTINPAKNRSRSLNVASKWRTEERGEENKHSALADISIKATSRHRNSLAPTHKCSEAAPRRSQGNEPTVREKTCESREPTGKENYQVKNTSGRLKAEIKSSMSMKQSLGSLARAGRQSESQLPSMRMHQKKAVGMEVLTRLAEPRHSRSTAPPVNNSSPAKSINNKAQLSAPGPPSFLSRTSSSRPRAKSTAELEREEMERMKPFKAQTIIGSSTVIRSRYKAATKLPLSSIRASAPSPSCESESKLGPPTVPKHPSFHYRRESGLCKPTPVRKKVQTFGESVQHYLNHGLRDSLPSAQIELKSTPKPPSFLRRQSLSNTATIKSSEEIELEECQKQFRARSISFGSTPINVKRSQGRQIPVPRQHPLAQRQRALTTSSPFRLRTNLRAESNKPPLPSTDELELSNKFRALPLSSSSTRFLRRNGAVDVPCHIRAQQQYKMAKHRKETITKDVLDEYDGRFKARPVPKTTYEGMPRTKTAVRMKGLTQLKPPKLSLSGRAEARKLFDQHSEEAREKENAMKQQKLQQEKEKEEEEIRRKRRSYANEGGFCFKAKPIRIEYI